MAFYARLLDRHELSADLYRRAAETAGCDGQLWYNLAASERSLGRLDDAAAACDLALRHEPDRFAALLLRSELRRATAGQNHVEDLKRRLQREDSDAGRMFMAYALGKELHDLGRYEEAFEGFALGAALRRRNLRYDVGDDERKLGRIAETFTRRAPPAEPTDAPARDVFIVGLPRSGTTLTERILTALPGVRSNGETNNLSTAIHQVAPSEGGDVFDRYSRADGRAVAQAYARLADHGGQGGTIVEKLPMNYLYVGAIATALPSARIIWVRRHALDSCFAMFRTLFGEAYPFSYDFGDLARYYAAYARLMEHWRRLLGERLFVVDYEDLVAHPATAGAALARRCGLEWSDEATDITRNRTASLTASAAQVREPIYQRSAGLWRNYARQLAPLRRELQQLGVDV
jgi:tetratricopeptide (TPR) repeat protein